MSTGRPAIHTSDRRGWVTSSGSPLHSTTSATGRRRCDREWRRGRRLSAAEPEDHAGGHHLGVRPVLGALSRRAHHPESTSSAFALICSGAFFVFRGLLAVLTLHPARGATRLHVTQECKAYKSTARKSSRDKVSAHARLRAQGLRPIQIWVPDVRSPHFIKEARRSRLAARSPTQPTTRRSLMRSRT